VLFQVFTCQDYHSSFSLIVISCPCISQGHCWWSNSCLRLFSLWRIQSKIASIINLFIQQRLWSIEKVKRSHMPTLPELYQLFTVFFLWCVSLKKKKVAGRVTQVVEWLPSNCEALRSNPNNAKKYKEAQTKQKEPKQTKNSTLSKDIEICIFRDHSKLFCEIPPSQNLQVRQTWWFISIICALGSLRQEDWEFQASLDYIKTTPLQNLQIINAS
jgi:hypothetical protein